jgi:hypothetical protein
MKNFLLFYLTVILIFLSTDDQIKASVEYCHNYLQIDSGLEIVGKDSLDHLLFNDLLQKYVDAKGNVNYSGLLKEHDVLKDYLTYLRKNEPSPKWNRAERLAYWINLYNASTLSLVLDHYPIASIRDIYKGNPWYVEYIKVGSKVLSLNQIEHEIIRPQFGDARIHFALNCAARSCPPLSRQAFTARNLDRLLEHRTRDFIDDPIYNQITNTEVRISQIFEWYRVDFKPDLKTWLSSYCGEGFVADKTKIQFQDYDWGLNGK